MQVADELRERLPRRAAGVGVAAPQGDRTATDLFRFYQLLDQTRLADARRSGHRTHLKLALRGASPALAQQRQLIRAAHQRGALPLEAAHAFALCSDSEHAASPDGLVTAFDL